MDLISLLPGRKILALVRMGKHIMVSVKVYFGTHDARYLVAEIHQVKAGPQVMQKALEKLIQRGQQSGEIAATRNPRALARFFVNTIQGMRVLGKGSPPAQRRQCLMDVIEVALDTL